MQPTRTHRKSSPEHVISLLVGMYRDCSRTGYGCLPSQPIERVSSCD